MEKENKKCVCTHHGRNLSFWRTFRQWTQTMLGEKAGYSQNRISDFENQEVIDDEILLTLAEVLDVNIEQLKTCDHEKTLGFCLGAANIFHIHDGGTMNKDNKIESGGSITTIYQADKTYELYERIIKLTEEITELKNQLKNK